MKIFLVEITKNIMRNSTRIGKTVLVLLSLLTLYNCSTSSYTPTKKHKNLSYLYNDSEAFLHPRYQIYNFTKDSSLIIGKIPYIDLLIKDLGKDFDKYALLEIHYRLYESLSTGGLIDSSTFYHKIMVKKSFESGYFSFKIKTPNYQKSYLSIRLKDVFSERARKDYLEIDKTHSVNRQSFLLTEENTQKIVFGSQLLIKHRYHIQSPLLEKHNLYIQEQAPIKTIASLPFSTQRTPSIHFKSDTTYLLNKRSIQFNSSKLVFLSFDTTKIKGVALYLYDSIPNYVHTPRQLLEPLTYFLSPQSYKLMLQDTNPKFALDKFWLKIARDTKHAKEMIQVYYHRVSVANKYFSSYKEGWRTDRGMIYCIYGEPAKIYKSQTLERWIYGSMDSDESLSFDFEKINNVFSNNDFRLVRDESYKKSWFQAINSWLNGRIYSIAK